MKKLFGLLLIAIIALSSCADSKTFERADGTKFVAEPYGWATKKIEGVTYEACIGNIVWDVIAVVIPVWLTGWELYEPVSYTEPSTK